MSESSPETNPLEAARQALAEALGGVQGVRVYMDPGDTVQPPTGGAAAVVSLPDLHWEAYCADPVRATFDIALVVPLDSRAITRLQEFVIDVQQALESVAGVTVELARIGSWNDSLPAYLLETEVAL